MKNNPLLYFFPHKKENLLDFLQEVSLYQNIILQMDQKKFAKLTIEGRVQGVFYRVSTQDKAREIGLEGWVRNKRDGAVEVLAIGSEEDIENLIQWCWQGPPSANVNQVLVTWVEKDWQEELQGFQIKETN